MANVPTPEAGNRFRDFDAFWGEQKREPVTLKIFGQTETLPAALPAGVVLEIMRLQEAGKTQADNAQTLKIAVLLFGPERIDRWVASGLDIVQLGELVQWVVAEYMRDMSDNQGGGTPKKGKK